VILFSLLTCYKHVYKRRYTYITFKNFFGHMFVICYNYKQSLTPPVMCIGSICFTLTVQVLLLLDHSSLKCIYTIILKVQMVLRFHAF